MSYRLGVGNYNPTTPCGLSGLGCPDCGGTCKGLGLFESGFDWTQWTWQEWATIGIGLYVVFSVFTTTARGAKGAAAGYQSARDSVKRAARRRRRKKKQVLATA